jgi:hypothetical protein
VLLKCTRINCWKIVFGQRVANLLVPAAIDKRQVS